MTNIKSLWILNQSRFEGWVLHISVLQFIGNQIIDKHSRSATPVLLQGLLLRNKKEYILQSFQHEVLEHAGTCWYNSVIHSLLTLRCFPVQHWNNGKVLFLICKVLNSRMNLFLCTILLQNPSRHSFAMDLGALDSNLWCESRHFICKRFLGVK